jgi:hypothetical protein
MTVLTEAGVRDVIARPVTLPRTNVFLSNGIQAHAGGIPLYRNGMLVGAIGVSGDGIDQDDFVAAAGALGFEVPTALRADQFSVPGVRLPFVRYSPNPNL